MMTMTKAVFLDKTEVLFHILFIIHCFPVVKHTSSGQSEGIQGLLKLPQNKHSMPLEQIFLSAALSIGVQLSYEFCVWFSSST